MEELLQTVSTVRYEHVANIVNDLMGEIVDTAGEAGIDMFSIQDATVMIMMAESIRSALLAVLASTISSRTSLPNSSTS